MSATGEPDGATRSGDQQTRDAGEGSARQEEVVSTAAPPWKRAASQATRASSSPDERQGPPTGDGRVGAATEAQHGEAPTTHIPLLSGTGAAQQEHGRTSVNLGAGQAGGGNSSARSDRGQTPSALRRPGRGPRRASLQVKRVDPWSVLKLALVLSVALFFVWLVAVGVLYGVLDGMGVWDKLNGTYSDIVATSGGSRTPLISIGRVFLVAAVIGVINIVLFTALATVGAFVYNVSADLAGGLEVTLAERE